MKNYTIKILLFIGLMLSFSCEDYLDIAPESELEQADVFSSFDNAQGFVEEMYAMVVDYGTASHTFQDYMFGDDAWTKNGWQASGAIDRGNLGFWVNHKYSYLGGAYVRGPDTNNTNARFRPRVWDAGMFGIRKANIVIESVDLMVNLSQAEKDVILGQAYFFRAYFHNEIMKFWGRFPYIDTVLVGEFDLPRPDTYKECALRADEDYRMAAQLLPLNWDDQPYGEKTLSQNGGRLTKGVAYAFQGKNLLFAASPLMHFNNQSSINTYEYDTELADMAVDAFAEVLKLDDQGVYGLANWNEYEEVFWKTPNANMWPGGTEFIFSAPGGNRARAQAFMTAGMEKAIHGVNGSALFSPTHNFINNNFGMANGLSIEDDLSGAYGTPTYDPTKPFENRDPRFYKFIVADRDVLGTKGSVPVQHRTAQLYIGGVHEKGNGGSKSGYMQKKFYPVINGEFHSKWNRIINRYMGVRLTMRLTDVYLMYAEALLAAKGPSSIPASYGLTAEGAINKIRNRAGIPNVHSSIVSDNNKFMDQLRIERSAELCFEAHRWMDIRRWGIAHLDKYRFKTKLAYPKDHSSFTEEVLIERVCEYPKHYWLPFEAKQTQFYEGFPQNPGW
ncbi:Starch-binding associating with outer membrane [Lutibacter agarilyticus]|uniref:Starch-binding associating with outer membrane n=1 Tax=Lutibacter agarilyticus TaxID=1109740 RepID=A0A238YJ36_9FLAO|nr:RagB/SusD family nutrient uptake outer membrane protein [Lutibacter agarilyticus]SNR71266.1 Starch-binding associating with outer membrane [Lutibacter agarilyticus]